MGVCSVSVRYIRKRTHNDKGRIVFATMSATVDHSSVNEGTREEVMVFMVLTQRPHVRQSDYAYSTSPEPGGSADPNSFMSPAVQDTKLNGS